MIKHGDSFPQKNEKAGFFIMNNNNSKEENPAEFSWPTIIYAPIRI
jgi:hypothetical protein